MWKKTSDLWQWEEMCLRSSLVTVHLAEALKRLPPTRRRPAENSSTSGETCFRSAAYDNKVRSSVQERRWVAGSMCGGTACGSTSARSRCFLLSRRYPDRIRSRRCRNHGRVSRLAREAHRSLLLCTRRSAEGEQTSFWRKSNHQISMICNKNVWNRQNVTLWPIKWMWHHSNWSKENTLLFTFFSIGNNRVHESYESRDLNTWPV